MKWLTASAWLGDASKMSTEIAGKRSINFIIFHPFVSFASNFSIYFYEQNFLFFFFSPLIYFYFVQRAGQVALFHRLMGPRHHSLEAIDCLNSQEVCNMFLLVFQNPSCVVTPSNCIVFPSPIFMFAVGWKCEGFFNTQRTADPSTGKQSSLCATRTDCLFYAVFSLVNMQLL